MKTKPADALKNFWLMLTEVPGWPDAPVWARLKRALPVLVPCAGMAFFAVWYFAIHAPRVRTETEAALPLVALEDEIAMLQLATSEQQVAELDERAASASRLLLDSPAEAAAFLKGLKKEAADRGFDATFISSDVSSESAPEGAVVSYIPVRGKLMPGPGNTEPFVNLLALLDRFASAGKRIDLMRLAVRADDQKWQAVEVNFRLVCPVVHEKLLNNPWIVGALALAALAFVAHSLIPAGGGSGVAEVVEDSAAHEPIGGDSGGTTSDGGSVRDAIKELSSNAAATRDPFSTRAKAAPLASTQVEKVAPPDVIDTVRLTALWTQNDETYALINDRICRVGEKLGRITLETATQDGVWVTHWKGRDFITLGTSFTLTTPALKAAALSLSTDS